jgi:hypothetical protein
MLLFAVSHWQGTGSPRGAVRPMFSQRRSNAMRRVTIALLAVVLLLAGGRTAAAQGKDGLNDEGFITTWLVLAPFPLEPGQSGANAITKHQLKDEAKIKPRAGDKIQLGRDLVWKEHKAKDFFVDFNDFLGRQTEDCVGFAVCYVHAHERLKDIHLKIGSDDQARVYLNHKEIFTHEQARGLDKDQDSIKVALEEGINVLVLKVVNEKVDWSGCARFTDKDGNVMKNLKISTSPKEGAPKHNVNDEGFITTWLLLAPLPLEPNQSGADAITKHQLKDEAKIKPHAGDKIHVGQELVWKEHKVKDFFVDFNDFLGRQVEDSVGYMVSYVHAPERLTNVHLRIGSDDQCRVYLNHKEIFTFEGLRGVDKDQDSVKVTLEKGVNVLVLKVVNEKGDWAGCARFTDNDGRPLKNLKVTAVP